MQMVMAVDGALVVIKSMIMTTNTIIISTFIIHYHYQH